MFFWSYFSGEHALSLDEATKILTDELNYPPDRAHHFVKRFDKNEDGQLSSQEFMSFKETISETYVPNLLFLKWRPLGNVWPISWEM